MKKILLITVLFCLNFNLNIKPAIDLGYGSHLFTLISAVIHTQGPIFELGCGDFSTPLLHAICSKEKRHILSADTDKKWLSRFTSFKNTWHIFEYIPVYSNDWDSNPKPYLWDTVGNGTQWGLVFIDHRPGERRVVDVMRLKKNAAVIVIHDSEEAGYHYEPAIQTFKYQYTEKRFRPWTTILSDTIDVTQWFSEE